MKQNTNQRELAQISPLTAVSPPVRAALLGFFQLSTIAQPPWWPHGSKWRSLLWSLVPGCSSKQCCASVGLPALLSQVPALLPPNSSSKHSHFFHCPPWKNVIPPLGTQRPRGRSSRPAPCCTACGLWQTTMPASMTNKTASPAQQNL